MNNLAKTISSAALLFAVLMIGTTVSALPTGHISNGGDVESVTPPPVGGNNSELTTGFGYAGDYAVAPVNDYQTTENVSSVPEPATIVLLGVSLVALGLLRRYRLDSA